MRDLLLALSGADRTLLLEEAPRDRAKYEGIGWAVLLTSVMAAFSSGIALHMALDLAVPWAVLGGAVWGTGIAGLDRWLVSANQRQDSKLLTLLLALPRLALALSVGLVMSTPLVLQVFSPEISSRLAQDHQGAKEQLERELTSDARFQSLPADRAQLEQDLRDLAGGTTNEQVYEDVAITALQAELTEAQGRLRTAEQQLICERDGSCGSARVGRGPAYEEKLAVFTRAQQDAARLQAEVATQEAAVRERLDGQAETRAVQLEERERELDATQEARDRAEQVRTAAIDADNGVLARLEALDSIGEERPAMEHAHWALFVFLTFLECLPVVIKLLLSFGKPTLYEQLSMAADADQAHHARLVAEAALEIAELERAADKRLVEARVRDAQLAADAPHGLELMQLAVDTQLAEDEHRAALHRRREELRIELDLRLRQRRLAAERADWDSLTPQEQAERLASTELATGPEGRIPGQHGPQFRRRPRRTVNPVG